MEIEKITKVWPEWQVTEELGQGSYGTVYKALRKKGGIESIAAIKVITVPQNKSEVQDLQSEGMSADDVSKYYDNIIVDLENEICLMEQLKGHPNVVGIEDYSVDKKDDGIGWDVLVRMELLTPFTSYICDRNLSENDIINIGTDILTALEECEKLNIIHRDIKPENIFVNKYGNYKLGDFGIAKRFESMGASHSQKGTFNYMAPEVANGTHYDAKVDTYSLGLVLYRLLNNNCLPFLDDTNKTSPFARKESLERRLSGEQIPPPSCKNESLANVILKSIAFNPKDRFESAGEFKKALKDVQKGIMFVPAAYNIQPDDADKTTAVRKADAAPEDVDKTTAVRKADAAPEDVDKTTAVRKTQAQDQPNEPAKEQKKSGKKKWFWIISAICILLVIAILIMTLRGCEFGKDEPAAATPEPTATPTLKPSSANVGDYITFGKYEQDNNTSNGKEDIEWLILDKQGNLALIISKYALDCKQYNTENKYVTWETCTLRTWLNGEFYNKAFGTAEKSRIVKTTVNPDKNPEYSTNPGNATNDNIFLLSIIEAEKYFKNDESRKCVPTSYAKAQRAFTIDFYTTASGEATCWWYLRSPGHVQDYAATVGGGGFVDHIADVAISAVRPALWINLES